MTDLASAWADAGTFPTPLSEQLQNQLICYGQEAETQEWLTDPGVPSQAADERLRQIRTIIAEQPPDSWASMAFSGAFIDELESLEDFRGQRLAHAQGLLTPALWLVYFLLTLLLIGVALFIPTRQNGALRHLVFIGCVALAVGSVTAGLAYLDRPGASGIDGTAMHVFEERALSATPGNIACRSN